MKTFQEFNILYPLSFQYPPLTLGNPYLHEVSDFYRHQIPLTPFIKGEFLYEHFLPVPCPSDQCFILSFSRYEDLFFSTDHEDISIFRGHA